ncbi:uncharacterized protein PFL1_02731 [Pseudozyma flocculosa PF-1]|uniref:Chromatin modification-related protein n=1 Tax=Pseudozyma flocculosa PF-1 TaxID=1277687 RepID=A0A061H9H5_9BASI|nr:uncharacterized protein PFL1_02731 [Pseudozyma flocculosa PF-1]EPQ29512.1 hypothetical protein PFL1_02731 [Pseudozyma flocculosa PF-1]
MPSAASAQSRTLKASNNANANTPSATPSATASTSAVNNAKHAATNPAAASSSNPPAAGAPATRFVPASFRNQPGTSALAGGIVGPEAAGLDQSSAEHFFVTLAAYADALDALPLDLTRSFSDLRELDAVLGSHLNSLTARLNHLTALIQDPDIDQGQRLLALKEVAEEARAYKMGGEDKIRVALNTAETIISHTDYIDALVDQLDHFPQLSPLLNPKKHLNLDQYYHADTGKLREQFLVASSQNAANGSGVAAGILGSTAKQDANGAASTASTGNKKRKVGTTAAAAPNAKGSKPGDAASAAASSAGLGPTPNKKRKTAGGTGSAANGSSSAQGGSKVARTGSSSGAKAEDDGWPRSNSNAGSRGASPAASSATGGAGNDDADERRYCFCNNVSYGDMIGCDDDDCEREWFHLGCVGLTKVPTGTWHCEACLERRAAAGKAKAKKGKTGGSSSSSKKSRR